MVIVLEECLNWNSNRLPTIVSEAYFYNTPNLGVLSMTMLNNEKIIILFFLLKNDSERGSIIAFKRMIWIGKQNS